ncbi:MAG: hypothetical protein FWD63_02885 [Propionibacteriaceae bacterium]|nr:hypothetical protein [Propionibacteriaceae bacterium]
MKRPLATSDERGLSESVQWAVLGAVVIGGLLALIDAALWLHGRSVAVAAVIDGASAASYWHASPGDGEAVARATAAAGGLKNVSVTVVVQGTRVDVTIDAKVPSFIGWATPDVHAHATRPKEQ